ncbi:MAG: 3-deoxy-7-phosphoheptulonate synthase, partial [Pseudomonadota bacterium]
MSRKIPATDWHPASWTSLPAAQQPNYPDQAELDRAVASLSRLPPIVTSWEVDALKEHIARAQRGEAFVLQGGDCAETFDECTSENIVAKLKILLQMSLVMLYGLKKPIVRVGRMAGQYAKPRSADTETRDGKTLPSFRGDLVNRSGFTDAERVPEPDLILRGYERAALTLNFVRSLIDGGFADLHHPEYWDLDWVGHSEMADEYRSIVNSISESLDFLEVTLGRESHLAQRSEMYAAHEGLHLLYEQAQTRYLDRRERWYNLTTHFPWIGMRTAMMDGAHVEYFRGIANPVGIKIGPG